MNRASIALTGFGLGAGLAYLADPEEGRRRRARFHDAAVHASNRLEAAAGTISRDLQNRVVGVAARTRAQIGDETAPFDDVLEARVRARLGHVVSHPRAIEVRASKGIVTLRGPVFAAEVEELMKHVADVPGVSGVENQLQPHERAENIAALQGRGPLITRKAPGWLRWTPTMRLLAGAGGAVLVAYALRKRTVTGAAMELAGLGLIDRAVTGGSLS
jgi:hypothetical protein